MKKYNFTCFQANNFDKFFSENALPNKNSLALDVEFNVLLKFMGDMSGKKVLDLGCGDGRIGIKLARYAREVVGYADLYTHLTPPLHGP